MTLDERSIERVTRMIEDCNKNLQIAIIKQDMEREAECRKALEDLIHIQGVLEAMYQRNGGSIYV